MSQQDSVLNTCTPPGVLVGNAPDDSKALFFDGLGQAPHAPAGRALAIEVLINDCDRKDRWSSMDILL